MTKLITAQEAAGIVKSGDTIGVCGFGGYGSPEEIIIALAERYQGCGEPKDITLLKSVSIGDYISKGTARLFESEGLVGTIYTSHLGLEPSALKAVSDNKVMAYLVPLGTICHLLRAIAGHKPGYLTKTGLGTFADPRQEGSKANEMTKLNGGDIVKLIDIDGENCLLYKTFPIDVCFIKATYADEDGNISFSGEPILANVFETAAATHNSGGTVVVQISEIVKKGTLKPKDVLIHSSLVDLVVKASPENSRQCFDQPYRPEIVGERYVPETAAAALPLSERKICARRTLLDLRAGSIINLGIGMPDAVSSVAAEEGVSNRFLLSIESGPFGGTPLAKIAFGASANPEALLRIADVFDLYDGGYLDGAVLGAAQIDRLGNVNVSMFGGKAVGPGGFINISQYAGAVYFIGSFTAGGLKTKVCDGKLYIENDGSAPKFVNKLEQMTFSSELALQNDRHVKYITERAVFELSADGIVLTETAPGIDLEKDILAKMEFRPIISENLKQMDERIFLDGIMGLKADE